jgi:polyketide synthase 2/polyketide synthase 5
VSSFGFSGTNAHVVLEAAPAVGGRPAGPVRPRSEAAPEAAPEVAAAPEVVLVAAGSPAVLPAAAARLAGWLEGEGAHVPLRDTAHTLALRREAGRGRLGVVGRSRLEVIEALNAFAAGRSHPAVVAGAAGVTVSRQPVWVFSGQGSQWPGMGRGLLAAEPAFAAALAEADSLISGEAAFSVLDTVRAGEPVTGCSRVQPVLFALQIALAAVWRAHGVEPAAVIGHSMGEVAAAVVAGALSLHDGVRVICRRSALLGRIAGAGAMASVELGRDAVERELAVSGCRDVTVAVLAAPDSTVVSGDPAQVARLVEGWNASGIAALPIAVDAASHSPQVEPLLGELRAALSGLAPVPPRVPFYTTVLDDPLAPPDFDAAYWCANLRDPVRLAPALAAAAADRHTVYVEVSPHPVVAHAVARSLAGLVDRPVVLPTLRRGEDEPAALRTGLAALHCAGVPVDWSPLYGDAGLADVPTITFDRTRHWVDIEAPPAPATPADGPGGPGGGGLPGSRTEVPGALMRHCWQAAAGTGSLPWLADHRVSGRAVLPGAVHYALALTTACQVFQCEPGLLDVTGIAFHEMLPLTGRTRLATTVTVTAPDRAVCEVSGREGDGPWVEYASAVLRRPLPGPASARTAQVDSLARRHPVAVDPAALYAGLRARGLEHGPAFAGITALHASPGGDSFWAGVQVPPGAHSGEHSLRIHPVLADLCLQALVAGPVLRGGRGLILPVRIAAVRVLGDTATAAYCHARITETTQDSVVGDVRLLDGAGLVLMTMDGVRFSHRRPDDSEEVGRWFLETAWHPAARPPAAPAAPTGPAAPAMPAALAVPAMPAALAVPAVPAVPAGPGGPGGPGNWLVIGEGDGDAETLAGLLHAAGARTEVWDIPLGSELIESLSDSLGTYLATTPFPADAVVMLCPAPADTADGPTVTAEQRARRILGIAQAGVACSGPPRLYAVTRNAREVQAGECPDLGQSALRGVMRVLACEHPGVRPTLVDTGTGESGLRDAAGELLCGAADDDVALRAGARHVARIQRAPLAASRRAAPTGPALRYGVDGFRLRAATPGDLDSLELAATGRQAPGPGQVELRVQAAGLNFRDVLTAMGLLPGEGDVRSRIGFECAGVVSAVGPGVQHLRTGDPVIAAHLEGGAFASFVTVSASAAALIPAGLDPVAAAGLPTAFMTAWYALRHVGRLRPGERVLIHSASGGTGMAAIAVARLLGADVLATAGTDEKRGWLRAVGISHVMDSRSLDFAEQTRAATGGEGVDVVLNSLSGPAIRAGLETLRPFGRFVELGVRDIQSDAPLGLGPFRHNVTLSAVDLIELQRARPDVFAAVLREVLSEFTEGRLKPLHCTTYPLSQASDAFRLMARAQHIGKLVLTVPEQGEATGVLPPEPPVVRDDGAYIVTGGLRGLGLATAHWLAGQGARHIVLNGRTAPGLAAAQAIRELSATGSRVSVVLGDIARTGTADQLVAAATGDRTPLRGVIHCAMVLQDAAVTTIRDHQLRRVWAPKVTGAWKLHRATAGHTLDWFAVFSSMASLLGNPGQGVYAAANSWLDAFASWRTHQGLPTLAVNWGPWGETGAATGFSSRGYETIPTDKGLLALHSLLSHGRVQTGVIPGEPDTWIPSGSRHSSFFSLLAPGTPGTPGTPGSSGSEPPAQDDPATGPGIRPLLEGLTPGIARRTALETYLAGHIRAILQLGGTALDPQTPLKALGFDSLLSMELRVRLESDLDVKLAGNFVWQHPTVSALAAGLAECMGLPLHSGDQRPTGT